MKENKETAAENVIRWIMLEVEEMIREERDCRECGEGVNEGEPVCSGRNGCCGTVPQHEWKISRETRKFLPIRKKSQGVTPGMGSKGLNNKEKS